MSEKRLAPESPSIDELAALRAIVEGTARSTGDEFFRTLVRHLASALGVRHSMVAEFVTDLEYDLAGTPCEDVARGSLCHYPAGVATRFPDDLPLAEMGIEGYLGV